MRALFTVALVVAVAGVALPAVADGGVHRSDASARAAADRIAEAARSLQAGNDALASGRVAARRTVTVTLPVEGFARAGLVSFTVGPGGPAPAGREETPSSSSLAVARRGGRRRGRTPGPTGRDRERGSARAATRIAWRVDGGTRHVRWVDGVRLRAASGGAFRVERGGRYRLVLRLVSRDGDRVVTVERRGFK
ncbi:MAG: hypothetical protein ABEJ40_05360 [Haloarculaceae archaeon]